MTPAEIIAAYEDLLKKAKAILKGPPFFEDVDGNDGVALSIEGDDARVTWCECEYDSSYIDEEDKLFPSHLLLMTHAEIAVWKLNETNAYKLAEQREREERAERAKVETEQRERELLATLKQKYEGNA